MASRRREHGAKPGDLIEIFQGAYEHWAVYTGDDEIVHVTLEDLNKDDKKGSAAALANGTAEVSCDNIWDVVGDSEFKVNNLLDNEYKRRKPGTIVQEARGMVGQKLRYCLVDSNCEHFATNLRYGRPESRQVRRTLAVLASVLDPICTFLTIAATYVCFCCLGKEKEQ